jgi:hypothetical protein
MGFTPQHQQLVLRHSQQWYAALQEVQRCQNLLPGLGLAVERTASAAYLMTGESSKLEAGPSAYCCALRTARSSISQAVDTCTRSHG